MRLAPFLFLPLVAACAGSPAMQAAERGDAASLKNEIASRQRAGTLTNDEAGDLAKAVAAREISTAKAKDAVERVREVRACAVELDDALEERAKRRDDAGAEAALARLEAGKLDDDDARAWAVDADPAWRAVGVRGLVRPEDRASRQGALRDGNPKVRRSAARAAAVAKDPDDLGPLFEAARLDPEDAVRSDAIRAIAGISPGPGADVANRLRDLWVTADDPLREDIAMAWAAPAIYAAGGREALRRVVAQEQGPGVLEAAAAILRDWRHRDREVVQLATGHAVRAIARGSRARRLQGIAIAQREPSCAKAQQPQCDDPNDDLLSAVVAIKEDDDTEVRLTALARLTRSAKHKDEAVKALETVAGQPGHPLGARAKFALASVGDLRIQAWIEQDLTASDPWDRLGAVSSLAALGRAARGAPLLVDPDASVRVRAACALMLAARSKR